jgi:hypothetical protein
LRSGSARTSQANDTNRTTRSGAGSLYAGVQKYFSFLSIERMKSRHKALSEANTVKHSKSDVDTPLPLDRFRRSG